MFRELARISKRYLGNAFSYGLIAGRGLLTNAQVAAANIKSAVGEGNALKTAQEAVKENAAKAARAAVKGVKHAVPDPNLVPADIPRGSEQEEFSEEISEHGDVPGDVPMVRTTRHRNL